MTRRRCGWVPEDDPLYVAYHDDEWGVPSHDDRHLFEMICLEGAQAGLSWRTILGRRQGYRAAFAGFEPEVVAGYGPAQIDRLVEDPGIIRHRGKIESVVANAQAVLEVRAEVGSLDAYLWGFVDGAPIVNRPETLADIAAETEESRRLSKDLKRRGFRFVGPTTMYAFMQAAGLVDDHTVDCFRAGSD